MNQNNAMNKYLISGTNSLNSIILYINWLLAEEFYSDNKLSKAIDYYEMAYSSSFTILLPFFPFFSTWVE